ncbi:MAG TPA: TonB family protein [Allosphingosinicella sp.]|jgi:TonB family protein
MIVRKAAAALLPLIFAAIPLASASASAAQAPPPAGLRWVAEWGERRCTLARMAANTAPVLALRLLPGSSQVELIFPGRRPPAGVVGGARAELVFSDGTRSDVRFGWRSPGDGTPRISLRIESALLDRLGRSTAVKLVHRGETLADVPLPQAGAAIAALRRCADSALAEWGVDSAARAALQRKPERAGPDVSWINSEDYPPAALRRSSSGEVVVRLTVNADGRVSECAVAVSSGDADLDATSCRLFVLRGRYAPALDAGGRPTAASSVEAVIWTLPQ